MSRATGNTEALKVSKTIESINKNRYSLPVLKERHHAAAATSYQSVGRRGSEMAPEVVSQSVDEEAAPAAAVALNNTKALRTLGIAEAEAKEKSVLVTLPSPPVSCLVSLRSSLLTRCLYNSQNCTLTSFN